MIERAREFAILKHAGQLRKYDGLPYIVHPEMVMFLVRSVPHTLEMLCAALLHDVVEDTPTTLEEIHHEFGTAVATLVNMLTDVSRKEDGNRKARKALDRDHLADASPQAQTIKLADIIDNTRSIARYDPKFAKVYVQEMRALLDVMVDGDPQLYAIARELTQ